jgi:hypothetical protein
MPTLTSKVTAAMGQGQGHIKVQIVHIRDPV